MFTLSVHDLPKIKADAVPSVSIANAKRYHNEPHPLMTKIGELAGKSQIKEETSLQPFS
jgi:hypothetical protein